MSDTLKGFIIIPVAVFILTVLYFGYYSFFAPKFMAVERQIYQQSQSYNDGMVRDLQDFRLQLANPNLTSTQHDIIIATIKQRFATYPINNLPSELQSFLLSTRGF